MTPSFDLPPTLGPRARWSLTLLAAAGYGLLAGLWTPRGPGTTLEALTAMVLALVVGTAAGFWLRSRWAMLAAPLTFVVVLEVVRLGHVGPTVDAIHLGSTYGVMAFAVGRGVQGLLSLAPMVLGAAVGAGLARRQRRAGGPRRSLPSRLGLGARRGVAVLTAAALVGLGVLVARPASTEPILAADGTPLAGSVAELTRVEIGGHDLSMMIRGRDRTNPVLLFLAGGPGGTELGAMRRHSAALEEDFVVVTLDQRGAGRSYAQLDPASTLTLDSAVDDTVETADYLRARFAQDDVYLVGQSWGTILGVLAAQRAPDRFAAFVGVGQMVSPTETDRAFYRDTLAWAREQGDAPLVETLTASGPPPYTRILDYEPALTYTQEVYDYDRSPNDEGAGEMSENIFVAEYSLLDKLHLFGGVLDSFAVLYPQLREVDLRTQAAALDVPVYLAQGAHEAPGRAVPAARWFAALEAPSKRLVTFETSGHRPLWEQPAEFHTLMRTVLAETAPSS